MLKNYQLRNHQTGDVLYEGRFETLKQCVESAVHQRINLSYVDLRNANLSHANLDDANMESANLSGANLCGANMSEGVFDCANFSNADVTYACFVQSSFKNSNFTKSSFAVTDMTDAVVEGCVFSCPSVFNMQFHRTEKFSNNMFMDGDKAVPMNKIPVMVVGLSRDIVYLDNHIKIGMDFVDKTDLIAAGDRHLEFIYGREVATFIRPVLYENIVNL